MVRKQLEWFCGSSIRLKKWKWRSVCYLFHMFLWGDRIEGFCLFVCLLHSRCAQLLSEDSSWNCFETCSKDDSSWWGKKVKRREGGGGGGGADEQQASVSITTVPSPTAANFLLCWGAEDGWGWRCCVAVDTKQTLLIFFVKFGSLALLLISFQVFVALYCPLQALF